MALSLVVVGVLEMSSQSVMSSLPFWPLNRSESFLLALVNPNHEMTTGAGTGCCRLGNEGWEDHNTKRPFSQSQFFTSSQVVGKGRFPPSQPELLGVDGEVRSGWVVDVDGDDNAGVFTGLNF